MDAREYAQLLSNFALATARSPYTQSGAQASNDVTQSELARLYQERLEEEEKKQKAGAVGSIGSTIGGIAGSVFGPAGTIAGSALGGAVGTMAGGGDMNQALKTGAISGATSAASAGLAKGGGMLMNRMADKALAQGMGAAGGAGVDPAMTAKLGEAGKFANPQASAGAGWTGDPARGVMEKAATGEAAETGLKEKLSKGTATSLTSGGATQQIQQASAKPVPAPGGMNQFIANALTNSTMGALPVPPTEPSRNVMALNRKTRETGYVKPADPDWDTVSTGAPGVFAGGPAINAASYVLNGAMGAAYQDPTIQDPSGYGTQNVKMADPPEKPAWPGTTGYTPYQIKRGDRRFNGPTPMQTFQPEAMPEGTVPAGTLYDPNELTRQSGPGYYNTGPVTDALRRGATTAAMKGESTKPFESAPLFRHNTDPRELIRPATVDNRMAPGVMVGGPAMTAANAMMQGSLIAPPEQSETAMTAPTDEAQKQSAGQQFYSDAATNIMGKLMSRFGQAVQARVTPLKSPGDRLRERTTGEEATFDPSELPPGKRLVYGLADALQQRGGDLVEMYGNSLNQPDAAKIPVGLSPQLAASLRQPFDEKQQRAEDIAREMEMFSREMNLRERGIDIQEEQGQQGLDIEQSKLELMTVEAQNAQQARSFEEAYNMTKLTMDNANSQQQMAMQQTIAEREFELQAQRNQIAQSELDLNAELQQSRLAIQKVESETARKNAEITAAKLEMAKEELEIQKETINALDSIGDPLAKSMALRYMQAQPGIESLMSISAFLPPGEAQTRIGIVVDRLMKHEEKLRSMGGMFSGLDMSPASENTPMYSVDSSGALTRNGQPLNYEE